MIEGDTCNAARQAGCDRLPARIPLGDDPLDLALDQSTHTLYTSDAAALQTSIIDTRRLCAAQLRCLR